MNDHYIELFDYENWAMRLIIKTLREANDGEANGIFAHILFAREIWYNRVANRSNPYEFEGKSLDEMVAAFEKNQQEWCGFVASAVDLDAVVEYKTLAGEPFSDRLKNILTHVVNHSTYHRGQITNTLKGRLKLISTDFIFYLREK